MSAQGGRDARLPRGLYDLLRIDFGGPRTRSAGVGDTCGGTPAVDLSGEVGGVVSRGAGSHYRARNGSLTGLEFIVNTVPEPAAR